MHRWHILRDFVGAAVEAVLPDRAKARRQREREAELLADKLIRKWSTLPGYRAPRDGRK